MLTAKQEVINHIQQLPDEVTMNEIIYQVYVLSKIKEGRQAVNQDATVTSQQLEDEMQSWFIEQDIQWGLNGKG